MTQDAIAFVEPNKRPQVHPFTWGPVRKIHEIGRYTIVEYVFSYSNDCGDRRRGDKEVHFHCYVDGRDLHESTLSLEMAMLVCVANRNSRAEQRVAYYAGKLLDLSE